MAQILTTYSVRLNIVSVESVQIVPLSTICFTV